MNRGDHSSRVRLLFVEDQGSLSNGMEDFLRATGFDSIKTSSWEEAIRVMNDHSHELLVVADLDLPGIEESGFVEGAARCNARMHGILVGHADTIETVTQRLGCSGLEMVSKPGGIKEVVGSIRRAILVREHRMHTVPHISHFVRASYEFEFRTDEVNPSELSRFLATMLLASRFCDAETMARMEIAVYEALVNAVEHGNLDLQSALKSDLLETSDHFATLRNSRMSSEDYRARKVRVTCSIVPEKVEVKVRDEGKGFDHAAVLGRIRKEPDPEYLLASHGRGMMLIVNCVDEVRFNVEGNEITLIKYAPDHPIPPQP
ncbi:MAG: ATP-binding protein [Thermodesulfobacteriota bacterium]